MELQLTKSRANKLQQLYSRDAAVAEIFEKATHGGEMTVDSLVSQTSQPRKEVVRALKELDNLGIGQFVTGRRGHPSRFIWKTDPRPTLEASRDVARMEEDEEVLMPEYEVRKEKEIPLPPISEGRRYVSREHRPMGRVRLSSGTEVTLPDRLSAADAIELAEYLRNMPVQ